MAAHEWTREQQLEYLLQRIPWTISREEAPEGDVILRCREIADATGAGETDAEIERDFWESLRASLQAYLHFGERPPVPANFALPWESDGRPTPVRLVVQVKAKTLKVRPETKRTAMPGLVNGPFDGSFAAT